MNPAKMKKGSAATEHYTQFTRSLGEEPAFRAMSPKAQILYVWLRLEWHGDKANNNGKICLSHRQAATRLGVNRNSIGSAFFDLQAKGFIVVKKMAALGVQGEGRCPEYELTELPLPGAIPRVGRKLYQKWKPGCDFEVMKHPVKNPNGGKGRGQKSHLEPPSI